MHSASCASTGGDLKKISNSLQLCFPFNQPVSKTSSQLYTSSFFPPLFLTSAVFFFFYHDCIPKMISVQPKPTSNQPYPLPEAIAFMAAAVLERCAARPGLTPAPRTEATVLQEVNLITT